MWILINEQDEVVIASADIVERENGMYVASIDCMYQKSLKLVEVESVPDGIRPFTHLYKNGVFSDNPYIKVPSDTVKSLEERNNELQEKLTAQDAVITEIIENILPALMGL